MSIIEGALDRIKKQREDAIPPTRNITTSPSKTGPSRSNKKKSYIIFVVVMVLIAAGVWLWLDMEQKRHTKTARMAVAGLSGNPPGTRDFAKTFAKSPLPNIDAAELLVTKGKYSEAVTLLKPLFAAPPTRGKPYLVMGSAYLGLRKLERAEKYLNQGLAIEGSESRFWLQLALVAQERGEYKIALNYLQEAERLNPGMPETALGIGYSNDALDNIPAATIAYQIFLRLTSKSGRHANLRRDVLKRLGELGR